MLSVFKCLSGIAVVALLSAPAAAQGVVTQKNINLRGFVSGDRQCGDRTMPEHGIPSFRVGGRSRDEFRTKQVPHMTTAQVQHERGQRPARPMAVPAFQQRLASLRQADAGSAGFRGLRHTRGLWRWLSAVFSIKVGDEFVESGRRVRYARHGR